MVATIVSLNTFRRKRSKARVFEALEQFYIEILGRLKDQNHEIDTEEMDEFIVQILGDHLVGKLDSSSQLAELDQNYRRFDLRLRECLRVKLKSLDRFEQLRRNRWPAK